MRLQVDAEFRDIFPAQSEGERQLLEESILRHGVLEPIRHWRGIIVDGYTRYAICEKHKIAFSHKSMDFADRAEAITWIIRNQIGRRNLSREQVRYLWGKHFANVTEPQFDGDTPKMSIRAASKAAGVPLATASRSIKFAKEVDKMPRQKRKDALAGAKRKTADSEPQSTRPTNVSEGRVPLSVAQVAASKALPDCMVMIDKIIATIKRSANDDTGAWLATAPLTIALMQARECIAAGLFYDVCPECNGKKGGCDDCRRAGWVPRFRYDELCGIAGTQAVSGGGGAKTKGAGG